MKKLVVGLMGPTDGGKSTICAKYAARRPKDVTVMAFAAPLKDAAEAAGVWDRANQKDPKQRQALHAFSQQQKDKHGNDIWWREARRRALEAKTPIVIFEDARFALEISSILTSPDWNPVILCMYEDRAESRWMEAAFKARFGSEEHAWAVNRSELEWRAVRDCFPSVMNDRREPVDAAVDALASRISDFETKKDFLSWFHTKNGFTVTPAN